MHIHRVHIRKHFMYISPSLFTCVYCCSNDCAQYPVYDKQLALRGRPSATRVNHLTDTMLGSEDLSSLLSLKAAESRHFLPFVLQLLEKHKLKLATVCRVLDLIRAGVCLEQFMQVLNREPRKMSPTTCQYLVDLIKEHNDCVSRVGIKMYPKHHQARQFCFC